MNIMPSRLKHVMRAANVATVATTVITSVLGKKETGSAAAPLNATSHILWGNKAASKDDVDGKHTAAGAAINAGAMYAWSFVLEGAFGKWVRRGEDVGAKIGRAAVAGAAVSALAYVTDYYVVPKRFTPGFEKRLSPMALATTYGVLAASLAAGAVWASRSAEA
jgi:hypothetical protein